MPAGAPTQLAQLPSPTKLFNMKTCKQTSLTFHPCHCLALAMKMLRISQDSLKMFLGGVLQSWSEPALCLLERVQRGKAVVFRGAGAGLQHDQPEKLADSVSELALQGFWRAALCAREFTALLASPHTTIFNCKPHICSLCPSCQRRFWTPPEQTGASQAPGQQPPRLHFVGLFRIPGAS